MLWSMAAIFGNIVEQLLITKAITGMNPVVYVTAFYLFSTLFVLGFHALPQTGGQHFDWQKASRHKLLIAGYIGGAFSGNALWFMSLYIMGLSMTAFVVIFTRVFVAAYAFIFMKDRFPLDKIAAFATAFAALVAFSFSGESGNFIGVLIAFMSCFGFSMEVICCKKLAGFDIRPESVLVLRQVSLLVLSLIALAIIWWAGFLSFDDLFFGYRLLAFIVAAALLGGLLVNMFIFYAMRTIRLSQYESMETMKPVLLAVSGVLLLGESMAFHQWVYGGIIILASLYFLVPFKSPAKHNIP